MVLRRNLIVVGAAVVIIAFAAQAHEGATGIVKERMDAMTQAGKLGKAITLRLRNRRDLSQIKADAQALQALAVKIESQFSPGGHDPHSDASDAIWKNWPDFVAKANAFAVESGKLAATPPDDFSALKAQARAVSSACDACHEKYRVKR